MSRLIRMHDVDQFKEVIRVPEAAVNSDVLVGIRRLNERQELEPALQEILSDPNETPHGPTEIADVLTSRVIVRGERRLAAFVLKGKSFPRVSSRHVAHQFAKLRTVSGLGLSVFVAVGNIQDDAQRDFVQMAFDAGTDYLIVDAVDCARLLIAYGKICPIDGLPFGLDGSCPNGHQQDPAAKLEVPVRGPIHTETYRLEDVSHNGAKRYSAVVMVDRHASRDALREVIRDSLPAVRAAEHHGNELVAARWRGTKAHVVWLFLAGTAEDARHSNWLARALWIDPDLDEAMKPTRLGGDEEQDGIEILWNAQHETMRQFLHANAGLKGPLLGKIKELVGHATPLAERAKEALQALDQGEISAQRFDEVLEGLRDRTHEIVRASGDMPLPPEDLRRLDTAAQCLFGSLHNIVIYYFDFAKDKWTHEQRVPLIRMALRGFERDLLRVRQELQEVK